MSSSDGGSSGYSREFLYSRPMPPSDEPAKPPHHRDDERALAARYKQELRRGWGVLQLAISMSSSASGGGGGDLVPPGLSSVGCAASAGLPLVVSSRGRGRHHGAGGFQLPDRRRPLSLGVDPGRQGMGMDDGLAQPPRHGGGDRRHQPRGAPVHYRLRRPRDRAGRRAMVGRRHDGGLHRGGLSPSVPPRLSSTTSGSATTSDGFSATGSWSSRPSDGALPRSHGRRRWPMVSFSNYSCPAAVGVAVDAAGALFFLSFPSPPPDHRLRRSANTPEETVNTPERLRLCRGESFCGRIRAAAGGSCCAAFPSPSPTSISPSLGRARSSGLGAVLRVAGLLHPGRYRVAHTVGLAAVTSARGSRSLRPDGGCGVGALSAGLREVRTPTSRMGSRGAPCHGLHPIRDDGGGAAIFLHLVCASERLGFATYGRAVTVMGP